MLDRYTYQSVLAASEMIHWRIEDIIGGDKRLDFHKPFMPESLARVEPLSFLNPDEKRILNQIRGNAYLSIFGLVEEFILPFVLDHARPQLQGDDYRVRALLKFAGEEAKHIQLFKRFRQEFEDGFGKDCPVIGPPEAIAAEVLKHDPLGVAITVLHIEWMHMEPGGNSGVFVWSNAVPGEENRLPNGVEVQMLELDWPKLHVKDGVMPPVAYVHGELFGVGGVKTEPDNPRGERSKSIENLCKGRGQWNTYDVVAVDGVIKLSVNGKFVNGISRSTQKKGYLCLESEGAEIHFRNIRILELPPGVTSSEQTAPLLP